MANIFNNFLTQFATGDTIKDYAHASRLFVTNNYERSPKYSWLFHVYFDLNPELTGIDQRQQMEAGLLVKSADLPKFRVDTKTFNNYNRPSIVQSKVRYDDINITFHDDSANIVRKLWFDYYNYYYRDMDINYGDATGSLNPVYLRNTKQMLGQRNLLNKFGYSPRKNSNISTQYIQAIRIYSLHQKRFSEYTLINPVITSYRHGTHQNGQDGTLENVMTLSYETVLYASGSARVARGFADLHYDKSPSPLTVAGGGTNTILGPGGIVNAISEVINDGSNRSWGSAAFKAVRAYQQNKNVNVVNLLQGELYQSGVNILRTGDIGSALYPTYVAYRGVNTVSGTGFQSSLPLATTTPAGSISSNGFNVGTAAQAITSGVASALRGNPTAGGSNLSGIFTNTNGQVAGGGLNNILSVAKSPIGLIGTGSQVLPTNNLQLQQAQNNIKSIASEENYKVLQEQFGRSAAFLSTNLQNNATTFQTGTSTVVQQASSALSNTPFNNLQIPSTAEVSSRLGLQNLNAAALSGYTGQTSTNPLIS